MSYFLESLLLLLSAVVAWRLNEIRRRRSQDNVRRKTGFHIGEVKLKFPRLLGIVVLFLGIPLMVAVSIILLWVVIIPLAAGRFDLTSLLMLPIIVFFSIMIWNNIKYWESLFTIFTVSDTGIHIENKRYGSLMLHWSDIDSASYSQLFKTIAIRSSRLERSVGICNIDTQGLSPEFEAAMELVRRHIAGRFREKLV